MNIYVPSPEESENKKRKKRWNFLKGLMIGLIFFGFSSLGLFWMGLDNVEIYTWLALGLGVLLFGFFAMMFGSTFFKSIFEKFRF